MSLSSCSRGRACKIIVEVLYDWLEEGNSRHTKEIRKKVVGAIVASYRML
jgi:hypothetical protein